MNATENTLPVNVWKETAQIFDNTMADFDFGSPAHRLLEVAAERVRNFGGVGQGRAMVKNSRRNMHDAPTSTSGQRDGIRDRSDIHAASYDLVRAEGRKVKDADDFLTPDVLTDVLRELEQQLAVLERHLSNLESHLNQK